MRIQVSYLHDVTAETRHCPFCFDSQERSLIMIKGQFGYHYAVRCDFCDAQGPLKPTEDLAIAWWDNADDAF